jgi:hypothetical protein
MCQSMIQGVDLVGESRGIGHVPALVHVHGGTEDVGAHGIRHEVHGTGGQADAPSVPLESVTADPAQLEGIAAGVHQLVAADVQFPIDRDRGSPKGGRGKEEAKEEGEQKPIGIPTGDEKGRTA